VSSGGASYYPPLRKSTPTDVEGSSSCATIPQTTTSSSQHRSSSRDPAPPSPTPPCPLWRRDDVDSSSVFGGGGANNNNNNNTSTSTMSAKQLRKLRELEVRKVQESIKALGASVDEEDDDDDDEGSEDDDAPVPVRKSVFAKLNSSSGGSSSSSSAPSTPRKEQSQEVDPTAQQGAPQKRPRGPRKKAKKGAAATDDVAANAGQQQQTKSKGGKDKDKSNSKKAASKRKGGTAGEANDDNNKANDNDEEAEEEEDEIDEDDLLLEQSMQEVRNEFEGGEDPLADTNDQKTTSNRPLALRRAHFSYEHERRQAIGGGAAAAVLAAATGGNGPTMRRMIQARGGVQGRTAHHRRLYLVTPTSEEPWPKPHDCISMGLSTRSEEVSFDIRDTPESVKSLEQLQDCILAQDPNQLQNFLQKQPFCVDGLLTLADYHRGQGSHEQVFQLCRRAVYALECNFHSSFSPFVETGGRNNSRRPRVKIQINDDDAWPGWSWFRAFWMYIHALAGQGMQRTALECCRLLLACSLPRDPIYMLPLFDYLCLRSRQYALLLSTAKHLPGEYGLAPEVESTAIQPWLDLAVPNVAYSVALATYLTVANELDLTTLNEVSIDHILHGLTGLNSSFDDELSPSARAHALLIRAMLIFPLALRPLLDEANVAIYGAPPRKSPSKTTWGDLLAQPPFADAVSFRHEEHGVAHGRLAMLYAKRCGPLWRADNVHLWLHACASRITSLFASSAFASELGAARKQWSEGPLCIAEALSKDYASMPVEEGQLPNAIEKSVQARLHPPRNFGSMMGLGRLARMDPYGGAPAPTASIHTPAILLFFQLLMPWVELDRTGTVVQALRWKDVGKGMKQAISGTLRFLSCLAQDAVTLTREGWDWLLAAME